MKVLVSFEPNPKFDNFEGARLRKTIKGALEMNDIEYTTNVGDNYQIAHLMCLDDEKKLNELIEQNIPIVVSCLYAEDDHSSSFIDYKDKEDGKTYSLSPKALKFLNKVSLILVPSEGYCNFLVNNGVTTPIEVCRLGVNVSRFDFKKEEELKLFYRYTGEDPKKKLVLAFGKYNNMDGITSLIEAAKKCPNVVFYYVGRKIHVSGRVKKTIKKAPKNIRFIDVLPDDIYRSAIMNASIFMVPGYCPAGVIPIMEAMASKTQLIVRKQAISLGLLEDGKTAYLAEFSETLASLVKDYFDNKLQPTITNAFEFVSNYNLKNYGQILLGHYERLLNNKGE